jgi:GNAT superfamily N-acetyltransferase
MIQIDTYTDKYKKDVIDLIVGIQNNEFGISISAEQQPDLSNISDYYQTGYGNFWVAIHSDSVIGTISLLDIGNNQAALRKMFVHQEYRGATHGTATLLLSALIDWSVGKAIRQIYLGTTSKFHAAHRFYEKNNFIEIKKSMLPENFPVMEVDTKFYMMDLHHVAGESDT